MTDNDIQEIDYYKSPMEYLEYFKKPLKVSNTEIFTNNSYEFWHEGGQ